MSTVADWLRSVSTECKIWVEDPEKHKEKIGQSIMSVEKTYFSYRIFCKMAGRDLVSVRHRYSEFESLRNQLYERYAPLGILVPSLPPKKAISSLAASDTSNPFVKERTCGLSLFCESVIENPFLRFDNSWKNFMRSQTTGSEDGDNIGEKMLQEALRELEVPYRSGLAQRIADVKAEAVAAEKDVRDVLEKVRAMQTLERQLLAANENVQGSMRVWADTEARKIRSLAGFGFDGRTSIIAEQDFVSTSALHSAELFAQRVNIGNDAPSYTGLLVVAALEHELAQIEALRELIKQHHDAILNRMEIINRTPSLSQSLNKPGTAQEKQAAALAECEEKLSLFYKGIVHFTLPMIARHRAGILRRVSISLCGINMGLHGALAAAAVRRCREMDVSPEGALASTNASLELWGIKSLDTVSVSALISASNTQIHPTSSSLTLAQYQHPQQPTHSGAGHIMEGIFDTALAASGKLPPTAAVATTDVPFRDNDVSATAKPSTPVALSRPAPASPSNAAASAIPAVSPSHSPPPPPAAAQSTAQLTAPVPPPVPAAPAVFKVSEKSNSLLDDLMGGSSTSNKDKDMWN